MGLLERLPNVLEFLGKGRKVGFLSAVLGEIRDFAHTVQRDGDFTDEEATALGELIYEAAAPHVPHPQKLTKDKLAELVRWGNEGRKLVADLF